MDWTQNLSAAAPPDTAQKPRNALPRLDQLTLTELVLPEQSNHYGTLFGPNALALLGKAAFLVATRFTRQSVVMAAANEVEFLQPVPVGSVLKLQAQITRIGRSSMTAQVLGRFDAAPGLRPEDVLRGKFEMVCVDAHGRPAAVAPPADLPASRRGDSR